MLIEASRSGRQPIKSPRVLGTFHSRLLGGSFGIALYLICANPVGKPLSPSNRLIGSNSKQQK